MFTLSKMAWRNLRRRLKRSLFTGAMIFVGAFLTTFAVGWQEGTYAKLIALATQTYAGHFQVTAKDFQQRPSLFKTVKEPDRLAQRLLENPSVKAVTQRIETAGLVSAANETVGALVVGVDPVGERTVTTLASTVKQGAWLPAGPSDPDADWPIILGRDLAKKLKVTLGDEVSFITQGADGSIAAELFRVSGIMETGVEEMDRSLALARLGDLQELLVLDGRAHRLIGVVDNLHRLDETLAALAPAIQPPNRLDGWESVLPELHASIQSDRSGGWISMALVLIVVMLGVMNAMLMSVMERRKEHGVMLALGTSRGQLIWANLFEALWLGVLSIGSGVALGTWVNTWFYMTFDPPIEFGGFLMDKAPCANNLTGNVIFPLIILAGCLISALYPAWRASRLNPVDALRRG